MIFKKLFEVILYFGLLTGAVFFVKETFEEFSNGATSYTTTQSSLSLSDLPTLILCWGTKYKNKSDSYEMNPDYEYRRNVYGKNISIDFRTYGKKENTVTLLENRKVQALNGLTIHLSELHMNKDYECDLSVSKTAGNFRDWQCYKITSEHTETHDTFDAQKFFVTLAVKFKSELFEYMSTAIKGLHFLMMSEANAYGLAAGKKFFDGFVPNDICKADIFQHYGGLIKITEVSEYLNIPATCSLDSYYQCLAKHFTNTNFDSFSDKFFNQTRCIFKELCTPFSLPFEREIPLCKNEGDRICYQEALDDLMMKVKMNCKKLCLVKDFKYQLNQGWQAKHLSDKYGGTHVKWNKWIAENWDWTEYDPQHAYIMEYSFEQELSNAAALQRRNHRSEEPHKNVYREYWIMSGMSLIGIVGGMMGLFIGFSFLGLSESIMDTMVKILGWMKKEKSAKHSRKTLRLRKKSSKGSRGEQKYYMQSIFQ